MRFLLLLFTFTYFQPGNAQELGRDNLSVSYFSKYAIQPGIAIGYKRVMATTLKAESTTYSYYLNPKVNYTTQPDHDRSYALSIDYGIARIKKTGKSKHALQAGLTFLRRSEKQVLTVSLGSGDSINNQNDRQFFLIPTLGYEYLHAVSNCMGAFTSLRSGPSFFGETNSLFVFFEIGMAISLK